MTDRPIIFSAPMVRALMEGRKTQTRRVLCPHNPDRDPPDAGPYFAGHKAATWTDREGTNWRYPGAKGAATGDRLWVRETWSAIMNGGWTIADARRRMFDEKIVYRADGNGYEDGDGWWPSIHMPREFSRLTLTVTDVRVQRLQDISADDAKAEGCLDQVNTHCGPMINCYGPECPVDPIRSCNFHGCWGIREDFSRLWNSLHGPDAWDANPWVVALTFTVQRCNIDAARIGSVGQ